MLTANRDLMTRARDSIKNHWGILVGITLTYFIISTLASAPRIFQIISLIISGPLNVGFNLVFLSLIRNKEIRFDLLFKGFDIFLTALGTYLLLILFIILWSLLLIIPGIMAACSYSMTFFILADDPSLGPRKAIQESKKMMYGNRWKLCCLGGRYTGWILLGIITFGIGFLWILPYIMTGFAHFYQDILDNNNSVQKTD